MNKLFASFLVAIIVIAVDQICLKEMLLWQHQEWGMLYWVDCPCHFGGGFSSALFLLGIQKQFPESWCGRLSCSKYFLLIPVFLIAMLWEIKEVFEDVPDLERRFNSYIWGFDFYYFNLAKDTFMTLLGATVVLRMYRPET